MLERLAPAPGLYPNDSEGLARGLSFARGRELWMPTIGVMVHFIGEHIPPELPKDRKESYLGVDIGKEAMAPELPRHRQTVAAHYAWLKKALADGRAFLFGDAPGELDLSAYRTIALLRKNCPGEVDAFVGIDGPLPAWYERVTALGHGTPQELSAEAAFAAARDAQPAPVTHLPADGDPIGLPAGAKVTVTPDDNARVPARGTLVAASAEEVVLHRQDPEAGDLHVHFPRLGYVVAAA